MIPDWCSQYIGIPYASGGRTSDGADCWGLYALVLAEQFGKPLPSYDGPLWRKGACANEVASAALEYAAQFQSVALGQEKPGDAIFFRMLGVPLHVGIVVYPGKMLHVEDGIDACVEDYLSFQWRKRIICFYRVL